MNDAKKRLLIAWGLIGTPYLIGACTSSGGTNLYVVNFLIVIVSIIALSKGEGYTKSRLESDRSITLLLIINILYALILVPIVVDSYSHFLGWGGLAFLFPWMIATAASVLSIFVYAVRSFIVITRRSASPLSFKIPAVYLLVVSLLTAVFTFSFGDLGIGFFVPFQSAMLVISFPLNFVGMYVVKVLGFIHIYSITPLENLVIIGLSYLAVGAFVYFILSLLGRLKRSSKQNA